MKKNLMAAILAGSMVLAGVGAMEAAAADTLVLATGDTTGTYYAVGGVMATVLNPLMTESSTTFAQMITLWEKPCIPCRPRGSASPALPTKR